MFRGVLDKDKLKRWIKIVTTIDALVEEACFRISPDQFMFREVDSTRVSMINFVAEKDYFDLYEFNADSDITICVQSDRLLKFSKLLSKADELIIEVEDGKFILASTKPYEKRFILPAALEEREALRIPQVDFKARARIVVPTLKDIFNDARALSETITIHAEENEISFISKSEEGFQAEHKLKYPDNVEILDIVVDEPSTSIYSLEYLYRVVKELASISGVVTLSFSTDYPLSLNFEMLEYETYQFIHAPRSEE